MAEKVAHLTQTAQLKPSIFDFIAQETLNDLLYPSAKKIIDVLALRNETFTVIAKWFDECFLVSHSLLQLYYLKKYGATFSEKFYGLRRIPLKDSNNNLLGNRELLLSMLGVSLFPYLLMKLDKKADEYLLDQVPNTKQKRKLHFMKAVIYCNSRINIIYHLWKFVQHLRFLSGKTDANSPLLQVAGVKLMYSEDDSLVDSFTFRNFIPRLLQRCLEIGAFFIQFLQWWETEKPSNLNLVPVPPPPQKNQLAEKYKNICPICQRKKKALLALSTSGFVYCFQCIYVYVEKHMKCPVTHLPATTNDLIRIYLPE